MPAFDQQALVDLFRQSFSPLTQLGAGRLQMEQAALERDYAQQAQAAAMAERYRQHIAGLQEQGRIQMEVGRQNAKLNQQSQENARRDAMLREAMGLNVSNADAGYALDYSQYVKDPDKFIQDVNALAGDTRIALKTQADNEATEAFRQQLLDNQSYQEIVAKMRLNEAQQLKIAQAQLVALAGKDKEKSKGFLKLATMDDIHAALMKEGEAGSFAAQQIAGQIAKAEGDLTKKYDREMREASDRAQLSFQLSQRQKGTPNREALRKEFAALPPTVAGVEPRAAVPPTKEGKGGATSAGVDSGTTNWLTNIGGPTLLAAGIPAVRKAVAGGLGWAGKRAGVAAAGVASAPLAVIGGGLLTGYGAGRAVDDAYGVSDSFADTWGAAQNDYRKIDRIKSVMPRVDQATALKLKAMLGLPELPSYAEIGALDPLYPTPAAPVGMNANWLPRY